VLKEILAGAAAVAAGVIPLSGVASADEGYAYQGDESISQLGLANVQNIDVLHNVHANVGFCDNNVNVLGVQVPVHESLNGIGIPILSPGSSEATGVAPSNCASSEFETGGTVQGS